tara:strand:- start:396 stop:602 length:207 start_codon:yes stop_codon:yes gene_type:complete
MKKIVNNVEIEMTAEEVAEKETENAKYLEDIQAQKTEIQNEKNKKASGKQKLKDLGLDDDEINALMGV